MSQGRPPCPSGLVCLLRFLVSFEDSHPASGIVHMGEDWFNQARGRCGGLTIVKGSAGLTEHTLSLEDDIG